MGFVGGMAGELIPGLLDEQAGKLGKKWLSSQNGILNHNIQNSLLDSLQKAIKRLKAKWSERQIYDAALSILIEHMQQCNHTQFYQVRDEYQNKLKEIVEQSFLQDLPPTIQNRKDEILDELDRIAQERHVLGKSFSHLFKDLEKQVNRSRTYDLSDKRPTNDEIAARAYDIRQTIKLLDSLYDGVHNTFRYSQNFSQIVQKPEFSELLQPPAQPDATTIVSEDRGSHATVNDKTSSEEAKSSEEESQMQDHPNAEEDRIKHNYNIVNILRNPDLIQVIVTPFVNAYLHHHEELQTFFIQRLPGEWMFFFGERLKDPSEEGTRTWRALLKIYQESMMESIQQIKSDTSKIPQMQDTITEMRDVLYHLSAKALVAPPPTTSTDSGQPQYVLNNEQREFIEEGMFLSRKIFDVAKDINATKETLAASAQNVEEAARLLGKSEQKLAEITKRIEDASNRLNVEVDRLERSVEKIRTALTEDLPNFIQQHYLYILFTTALFISLAGLVVFAIYPDNYPLWLLWTTSSIWGMLVLLLTYPLWRFHPWNTQHAQMPSALWLTLVVPFLFILVGFPAFARERIMEPFKPPMTGDVNVVVSNFDGPEGRGIGQALEEELRIRLKHLDTQKLQIRYPHQRLFNDKDTRQIANRWNANIVVRGYEVSGGRYRAEFFMRDPVEGGIELTDDFYILPERDVFETSTSERGSIIVTFTRGLIDLFSDELRADYPQRLETAIDLFQQTIDMVDKNEEDQTDTGKSSVQDTLYFFKGRSQMKAVEIATGNITQTRIYSPSQEALLRLSDTITWTDAVESYDQALELNENYSWAYIGRGIVYYNQARETDPSDLNLLNLAFNEFDIALKKEGENRADTSDPTAYIKAKAWANISNIYLTLLQESEGEMGLEQYQPGAIEALNNALDEYQHAEDFDPRNMVVAGRYPARIHYGLGVLSALEGDRYGDEQKYQDAITSFDTCLDLADEDDPRATRLRRYCETEQAKAMEKINDL
jgi:tetratricopeptide (TPR) repeat protein